MMMINKLAFAFFMMMTLNECKAEDANNENAKKVAAIKSLIEINGALDAFKDDQMTTTGSRIINREGKVVMAQIYSRYFTAEEIDQMLAYHSSPVARKLKMVNNSIMEEFMW